MEPDERNSIIWKTKLSPGVNDVQLPKGAKLLHLEEQWGMITMWFQLKDGEIEKEKRTFVVVATGEIFNDKRLKYLNTVITGSFVWHVYERLECK